jgi:hypothetical protein
MIALTAQAAAISALTMAAVCIQTAAVAVAESMMRLAVRPSGLLQFRDYTHDRRIQVHAMIRTKF